MTKLREIKGEPVRRELYQATAERDGRFWLLKVPALRGVRAQVRRLEEAEEAIREAIALWLEVEPAEIDVQVNAVLGDVDMLVDQTREVRARAEELSALAADLTQQAAAALISNGLTVRDAGDILGISHQRIAQLISEGAGEVVYEAKPGARVYEAKPGARTARIETSHGAWLMSKSSSETRTSHPAGKFVSKSSSGKFVRQPKGR